MIQVSEAEIKRVSAAISLYFFSSSFVDAFASKFASCTYIFTTNRFGLVFLDFTHSLSYTLVYIINRLRKQRKKK